MRRNSGFIKIAIVGRPNVGKSSLFNRITGSRRAIVEPSSGTTRDRLHVIISWKGKKFTLIDTGGYEETGPGGMAELVLKQLRRGLEEADIIVFMVDGISGITHQDIELASILRKTSKKIYLVVNKVDSDNDADRVIDFYELGFNDPYAISAMHGRGIDRLCNDLAKSIGKPSETAASGIAAHVAIVGKPNVGKSSYLNAILSEERVIVHHTAGTTRDAIDTDFKYKDREYVLIDTAGIRHNAKISRAADFYGSVRSQEAIKRADVAVVLIDGYEGMTKDDTRIIDFVLDEGKGLVIGVSKWDLVKGIEMSEYAERLMKEMIVVRNFPIVFISSRTRRNIDPSLDVIWSVYDRSKTIIPHAKLSETLKLLNGSAEISGKRIKFKFLVQEGASPVRFVLGVKGSRPVADNIKRYVENFFRTEYNFEGVPLRIRFEKMSKYDRKKR
ncbi:MAG: ribosome biogenesis GTPase Der [Candidatus Omnitrophica bacterium]|nr:ribosome biogenesis GTPase Der [Candidatus Omnitrophota bacterium]